MSDPTTSNSPKVQFSVFQIQEPSVEAHNFASDIGKKVFGNIGPAIINIADAQTVIKLILENPAQCLLELQRAIYIAANILARHRDLQFLHKRTQEELQTISSSLTELEYERSRLIAQHEAEMNGVKKIFPAKNGENEKSSRPHPDPKFSGNDTKLISLFIRDLQRKLEVNADCWQSERLLYKSVEDIIKLLQQTFGDINEQETAQKELKTCFQKDQSLATFLPNWLALSELSGFNDCALISFLKDAIHPNIKNRISYINEASIPTKLSDYVSIVRQQDETLRSLDHGYYNKNPRQAQNLLNNTNTTRLEINNRPPRAPQITELTTSQGGDPMDLSSIQINGIQLVGKWTSKDVGRKPTNDVEKVHRRAYNSLNSLCLICDSKDHIPCNCPNSFQNKKRQKSEKINTIIAEDDNGKESEDVLMAGNA